MAAAAAAATLQQALLDMGADATTAAGAVDALSAAGGISAAQVTAAVAVAVAPLTAAVAALQAQVAASHALSARAWNASCGDGVSRPYTPVPNAAGAAAPPGEAPVLTMAQLTALTAAQLNAWCGHYGVPLANTLSKRRGQLALQLGVTMLQSTV
jgi:hypothetical protein